MRRGSATWTPCSSRGKFEGRVAVGRAGGTRGARRLDAGRGLPACPHVKTTCCCVVVLCMAVLARQPSLAPGTGCRVQGPRTAKHCRVPAGRAMWLNPAAPTHRCAAACLCLYARGPAVCVQDGRAVLPVGARVPPGRKDALRLGYSCRAGPRRAVGRAHRAARHPHAGGRPGRFASDQQRPAARQLPLHRHTGQSLLLTHRRMQALPCVAADALRASAVACGPAMDCSGPDAPPSPHA